MEGRHRPGAVLQVVPLAAVLGDAEVLVYQGLCGGAAEAEYDLGPHRLHLALQVGVARPDLGGLGLPVAHPAALLDGGPAFHGVGQIDLVAGKVNGREVISQHDETIYPGEILDVELQSYEALAIRRGVIQSNGLIKWKRKSFTRTVFATSAKSLGKEGRERARKAALRYGKTVNVPAGHKLATAPKSRKKKKATAKPKKKARKKPAKKRKPAARKPKRKAAKKRAKPTCSICGKKVANIFKHRWKAHPHAVKTSLKKAMKKARGSERKKLKSTLATLNKKIRAARRAG